MIKKNTVACVHSVTLSVVNSDPIGIELRDAIRAARIEWSSLALRYLLHQTVKFTSTCLVDPSFSTSPKILTASKMRSVPRASLFAVYSDSQN